MLLSVDLWSYADIPIKLGKNEVLWFHTEVWWLSWRKTCVYLSYMLNWLLFFHGISFSLGGTTVRQTRAILIYLADIFLKLSEVSWSFLRRNWHYYLLPVKKLELSHKNLKFRKLVFTTMNYRVSSYLKPFLMRIMMVLMNMIFDTKWVSIWKIWKVQWTSAFQVTNHAWLTKRSI